MPFSVSIWAIVHGHKLVGTQPALSGCVIVVGMRAALLSQQWDSMGHPSSLHMGSALCVIEWCTMFGTRWSCQWPHVLICCAVITWALSGAMTQWWSLYSWFVVDAELLQCFLTLVAITMAWVQGVGTVVVSGHDLQPLKWNYHAGRTCTSRAALTNIRGLWACW